MNCQVIGVASERVRDLDCLSCSVTEKSRKSQKCGKRQNESLRLTPPCRAPYRDLLVQPNRPPVPTQRRIERIGREDQETQTATRVRDKQELDPSGLGYASPELSARPQRWPRFLSVYTPSCTERPLFLV